MRFISGGAAGVVAHIKTKSSTGLEFDQAWYTGERLLPDPAYPSLGSYRRFGGNAPMLTPSNDPNFVWTFTTQDFLGNTTGTWARMPAAGDEFVLVESTKFYGQPDASTPAIFTAKELLADPEMDRLNRTLVKGSIDNLRSKLEGAIGATNVGWVSVPSLYFGWGDLSTTNFATDGQCVAYNPGLPNVQPGSSYLAFPRQYGPRNGNNVDLFESDVVGKFPNARFVDDWYTYHLGLGEVHCGTNAQRAFFPFNWWTRLP